MTKPKKDTEPAGSAIDMSAIEEIYKYAKGIVSASRWLIGDITSREVSKADKVTERLGCMLAWTSKLRLMLRDKPDDILISVGDSPQRILHNRHTLARVRKSVRRRIPKRIEGGYRLDDQDRLRRARVKMHGIRWLKVDISATESRRRSHERSAQD